MDGKVKTVDQAKKQMTLENGTMFTIPANAQVEWAAHQAGQDRGHLLRRGWPAEDGAEGRGQVLGGNGPQKDCMR